MTVGRVATAVLMVAAVVVVGGCTPSPSSTSSPSDRASARSSAERWNSNTDPCAMLMHDVCAPLLLYFGRYQRLPAQVEELAQVPGVTVPELTCPVSGQKYIYNPQGPPGLETGTRIILYDATPAHAGRRWGIVVREPAPGQALVVNVIAVPESVFSRASGAASRKP